MAKQTVLVIDDEKMMHVVFKALLGDQYNLLIAMSAQEGIDLLAEHTVNLIMLDIQMPKLSGIELLESIMIDASLRSIPTIVMTGKATDYIENKARELGATDFFNKAVLLSEKKIILNAIKKNISSNVKKPEPVKDYKPHLNQIIKTILRDKLSGDLITAGRKLGTGLIKTFNIHYFSLWTVKNKKMNLIVSLGDDQPEDFGPEELKSEDAFIEFTAVKRPYLTNNPTSEQKGMFADKAIKLGLSSEIGVPLFKITKEELVNNKMQIPSGTPIFGFIIIKRNRVFTTKEFKLLSQFIIQSGSVLYDFYQDLFSDR
jgi:CheY-like chemotaxis protein